MRRVVIAAIAFGVVVFCALALSQTVLAADDPVKADDSVKADKPAAAPADRVVVMYFHRTQRCPTCRRMGSYSEEAVAEGFAEQIKDGTVEFHYVDFQDEKNAKLTKGYKVGGPTLMVVKIVKNKPVEAKNLTQIWAKNGDKDAFFKYVRENVTAAEKSESKDKDAVKPETDKPEQKTK